MKRLINNQQVLQIHPIRKYFEFLALEYTSGIRLHLSGSIKDKFSKSIFPKSKGAAIYFKETIKSFLIGELQILAQDYLERKLWPKKPSIKYNSIPNGIFRIMLNQGLQKLVQMMALTGEYTATDIAEHANEYISPVPPLSAQIVSKYLYYFWNVLPSKGHETLDPVKIIQFLVSDGQLSKVYAGHIDIVLGKKTPFEIALKLGMNEKVTSKLNNEIYMGFALTVVKKNEAMMSNRLEDADTYSKIMIRDSQVLRNLGHKPKKRALRDSVKVIYDGED